MTSVTARQILDATDDLLATEANWITGKYKEGDDKFCLRGAFQQATDNLKAPVEDDDTQKAWMALRLACHQLAKKVIPVVSFNDDMATFADIKSALKIAKSIV